MLPNLNDLILSQTKEEFEEIIRKVVRSEFQRLLSQNGRGVGTKPEADELLTVKQCAEFLSLSKATVYGYVHRAEIPVYKHSKRLYFSKQELIDWIKTDRKKTVPEIASEVEAYLQKKGGKQ